MRKEIEQILSDIYQIDPALKEHESVLIEMIEKLLLAKPEVKVDEIFVSQLRQKLEAIEPAKNNFSLSFFTWNRAAYAFTALALIAVATVSLNYFFKQETEKLVLSSGVERVENNAFGEIAFSVDQENEESLGRGGGGMPLTANGEQSTGSYYPTPTDSDTKAEMYVPSRINYNFIYNKEEFNLENETMNVYRKSTGGIVPSQLAGLLSGVKLDVLDLGKLKNTEINSLQINENKDYGYTVYIEPKQGYVSISMNWEKWPQDVYQRQLTESERLSDQEAISMAKAFVKSYGINVSNYGEPEIVDYQNHYYISRDVASPLEEVVSTEPSLYIPDSASVVYPLLIDSQEVYDQSGRKTGINIDVSARYRKVTYASNITINSFQSSAYQIENDWEKIIDFAKKGGTNSYYQYEDPTETIEIELGDPFFGLVKTWQVSQDKYNGEELYIPSLIFPVLSDSSNGYFYQQSVTVPLVGMENYDRSYPDYPMPLLQGNAVEE